MAVFRKIGILTSGGDAPGMNACIKAVTNKAISMGIRVVGVIGGYAGLVKGEFIELTTQLVGNVARHGGTILYSSRLPEFKEPEVMAKAIEVCHKNEIDALICIGGDGTFRGATALTRKGIPSIGLPGTIDNDITATDYTIGFDSSVNSIVEMIDKLCDTCESHARLNVVEVMGRNCGLIALYAAISCGAVAVAVPEIPFDEAAALKKIRTLRAGGKRGMIALVCEGVTNPDGTPYSETFRNKIIKETGVEAKFVRTGHIIRGGDPTARERKTAMEMGTKAVELLVEGKSNLVMCKLDDKIVPVDIDFALVVDRMYKGTLEKGDLDQFTPEQVKEMEIMCQKRHEKIETLYRVAQDVSF